ncbi:MAG: HEAT repeat domain-containing protein, partial [Polyangiaceae bacterium]
MTLLERLKDPGFTPRVREIDPLVDLLLDEELETVAARASSRVGQGAFEPLQARFEQARPPLRAHIVRVLGRLIQDPRAVEALLLALNDDDPKTRRNAAIALGHVRREGVEEALLATWDRDPRPEMRRTLVASLGKVGSPRSLPILRESTRAHDPELVRIALKACSMVERTASREDRGRIDASRVPEAPVDALVEARAGIEDLLADELSRVSAVSEVRVLEPGLVRIRLAGRMDALFAARTMTSFRFRLPPEAVKAGERVVDAMARAATSDLARSIFATWTSGSVRYRIAWGSGGHKRAATWDAAGAIKARAADWVNDPTASTWEIVASVRGPSGAEVVDVA